MKNHTITKPLCLFLLMMFVGAMSGWGQTTIDIAVNGDFENWTGGNPDGWVGSTNNIPVSGIVEYTDAAYSGTKSCQLIRTSSTHARFTTEALTILADTEYTVTYYVRGKGEIRNAFYRGGNYSGYSDYTVIDSDDWTEIIWTFEHGSAQTDVEVIFSVRNTDASRDHLQLDAVTITYEEPEGPLFSALPDELDGLSYVVGNGPSDSQSFVLTGENLEPDDATITIDAPANFQISLDDSDFSGSKTVDATDGSLSQTVYVRLAAGLGVNTYSGNVEITGGGADAFHVHVSGRVVEPFDIPYSNELRSDEDRSLAETQGFDLSTTNAASGYTRLTLNAFIETPIIDFTEFDYLKVSFSTATFGGFGSQELALQISVDGGPFVNLESAFPTAADPYVDSEVVVDLTDDYNHENGVLRFTMVSGTNSTRFRDMEIEEYTPPAIPDPVLDLAEDTYFENQTVFVDNYDDYETTANIYYTLDGEDPTDADDLYDNTEGILLVDGNGPITLKAIAIDGADESGITTAEYVFPENVANIEDLRGKPAGSRLYRLNNEATLIGQDGFRSTKFFQDDSGFGIQIDDPTPAVITTTYNIGDNVASIVGTRDDHEGQLRFRPSIDPGDAVSSGNEITPLVRTLGELTIDDQSRLVMVYDVEFEDGDGTETFGSGGFTTNITDPSIEGFTGSYRNVFGDSDVTESIIPEGLVNITGIVQQREEGDKAFALNLAARSLADFTETLTFYFRGPDFMDNDPHEPEIWGPFNDWSAATMTYDSELEWWYVDVLVPDASAEIEYQARFSEGGATKFQRAFEDFGSNPTFTTTTGEIWIDAYEINNWSGNDFYLELDKVTEDQPLAIVPSDHVTEFSATTDSYQAITVTWDDSDASAYLIKGSDVGFGDITDPDDGIAEADGLLVKNVSSGEQSYQFAGLNPGTTYYFKIFPYNGNNEIINYKTDGEVPAASATTPQAIFSENMGTGTANSVNEYDGWENNPPVVFTGTADVRTSETSSGYSGASGGSNVFFTNTVDRFLLVEGIDVTGYDNLSLTFGQHKAQIAANNELKVEVSSDGDSWTELTYSREVGSGTAVWALIEPEGEIPGNTSNLRIRFTQTSGSYQFRVDDITLYGSPITDATYNTITINGTNEGWRPGEIFDNITGANADFAHFTWDEDYLYFAVSGSDANVEQATFMYFDTNPDKNTGTTNAYTWDNNIITSFLTDYVVVWKNESGQDYIEVREWNGSEWNQVDDANSANYGSDEIDFAISGNYREVRIKRSVIGNPVKITVASITEQIVGKWRYFGWPSEGWTDGNRAPSQTMTHGYTYELKEFVYPNEAQYLQENIIVEENTTINEPTTVDNVYILPEQNLTVNEGIDLTVNGKMFIFSNENGTGSLIHHNEGVEAIVQYYMPVSTGDWPTKDEPATDWYYIAPPVMDQNIEAFLDGHTGQYDLYRWGEAEALWLNYKADGGPPNLFSHTVFESRNGYLTAFQFERTHEFDGELAVGDAAWSDLSYTPAEYDNDNHAGWHLIGNPYASGIRFVSEANGDQQWTASGVELTPQYWDGSSSSYEPYTENEIIPSATSFFIRVTGATNSLTIPAAAREHLNGAPGKSSGNYIILAVNPVESSLRQSSYIRVVPDAIEGFDNRYDSRFRPGYAPVFYSARDEDMLLVHTVNEIQDELIIPFVFEKLEAHDSYVIQLERNIEGVTPYLIDLKLENEHKLSYDQPYLFFAEAGDAPERFELRFAPPTDDDNPVNITQPGQQTEVRIWQHNNILHVDNPDTDLNLYLYNISGRQIKQFDAPAGQHRFELKLPAGAYFVKSSGQSQYETVKIIIQ